MLQVWKVRKFEHLLVLSCYKKGVYYIDDLIPKTFSIKLKNRLPHRKSPRKERFCKHNCFLKGIGHKYW